MNNLMRQLRSGLGWSQADLAERLGVSRQTVNAIETGRYDPSLPLAFKIAKVFDSPSPPHSGLAVAQERAATQDEQVLKVAMSPSQHPLMSWYCWPGWIGP